MGFYKLVPVTGDHLYWAVLAEAYENFTHIHGEGTQATYHVRRVT